MHLKVSSAKRRPFCFALNVLNVPDRLFTSITNSLLSPAFYGDRCQWCNSHPSVAGTLYKICSTLQVEQVATNFDEVTVRNIIANSALVLHSTLVLYFYKDTFYYTDSTYVMVSQLTDNLCVCSTACSAQLKTPKLCITNLL